MNPEQSTREEVICKDGRTDSRADPLRKGDVADPGHGSPAGGHPETFSEELQIMCRHA